MRLLLALLILLCPLAAHAQIVVGTQTSNAVPIYAGNPVTQNLIGSVTVNALAGEVYLVIFESEIAPYSAPCGVASACLLWQPMAVTTAIYAGPTLPAKTIGLPAGAVVIAKVQGVDISVNDHDYYSALSRPALYQATADGPVTFGVYAWGFSNPGGFSAIVYPGTFSLRAVRLQ